MKRYALVCLLWMAIGASASAAGLIIVEDSSWWPGPVPPRSIPEPWPDHRYLHPPRPHLFAPLEVERVKVRTKINDQIAVTSVDEEFYNPNSARLEGTFVFPVPKGAHLDKFTMEIDGRQVEAELLSVDKARHIYEDIVRKMRDPALLEYADRDLFKVRIFPIEPNSRKRVTLSYTQLLKSDNGLIAYVLPLSTEKYSCKPVKEVSVRVDLESKRPLKSIYSPSHSMEIKRDGPLHATAGYEAGNVQPDADLALYFAPENAEIGMNLLTYKKGEEGGYFLLLTSPGLDSKEQQIANRDIGFVLDTSGSMAGKKLEQAKKALEFCLENLNSGDRFEVIRFSTEVEPLFSKLVDANQENRERAEAFIKELKPMGATAINDALKKALELRDHKGSVREDAGAKSDSDLRRPYVIIFLTDGRPTIGATDEEEIVSNVKKHNDGDTRIFCFGIGTDVNTHLLDKIGEQTRAFTQYVLPEEDLELKVSNFFSKIKDPVLTNPKLQLTGGIRTSKVYPPELPDLFKGQQLVLVGRYSGHGDAGIVIEGAVNGTLRKFTYEANFGEASSENEFIPRLWATRRVGYLLDEIRLHGDNSELREEVTELARRYNIVTPYTAYLIAEDERRRDVPVPLRSMQSFEHNSVLREEAAQSWQQFRMSREGDSGVASAMSGLALKSADAAAPAAVGAEAAFARRYGGIQRPGTTPLAQTVPEPQPATVQSTQPTAFVGGKTFFQNGSQWIDAEVQKLTNAKRQRIQFGSKDYFDFTANHPGALAWLALGQNVQFVLDSTIYEIFE